MAAEKNRVQKILEDANIKLSSVVSDTSGAVATKLIDGLIAGRKDLEKLIEETYHKKLKAGKTDLLKALTGRVTEHHRFMLRQIKSHMEFLEKEIAIIDGQMDELLKEDEKALELLSTIPGVDKKAATKIIAQTGTDMNVFASEKHLAKWVGICPGNNESGDKKKVHELHMATNI